MTKPNITTKNLSSLSELMIAENLQYKKCLAYAGQVGDPALQAALGDMAQRHKTRYDGLLTYLNGHK